MNYRHGFHAGNFADVVKHVALMAALNHLKKKETAFRVIDTHAGRGLYDLCDAAAKTTGESENGIERLHDMARADGVLGDYLDLVRACGAGRYPGSPLIAAKMLRPQDRLVAIEKHPEEAAALKETLAPFRSADVDMGDGYGRLLKLLPPPSRRGLVLMDPPFEQVDEFSIMARTLVAAVRKFATGIYLAWYPVKARGAADAFVGEVLAGDVHKALTIETQVAPHPSRLTRAGLLVINPPFGFADQMRAAAAVLMPRLGDDERKAEISVTWRAGQE
jgi:23S rRNA (adenine2030-N6)-methyltransferase